jgi:Rrf2 family protein
MKLITRDTDYALRAICFIIKNKKKVLPVSVLAKETGIPRPFLRKILQLLSRRGILLSHKGQDGGFSLARPVGKINLVDLIEAFQGPLHLNECFFKKLACPNIKDCILKQKIDRLEKYVVREIRSITVASLLGKAAE